MQNVLWSRASLCVSVCLSAAVRPNYCTDPDVTSGRGRGCPLVVHYWVDLQSGHGLRCYGNITRTLVTRLSIPRYDDIVRTADWAGSAHAAGRREAGDGGRRQNRAPHTGSGRGRPAGRRLGRSQHYCANLDCGLPLVAFWQQKANAKC